MKVILSCSASAVLGLVVGFNLPTGTTQAQLVHNTQTHTVDIVDSQASHSIQSISPATDGLLASCDADDNADDMALLAIDTPKQNAIEMGESELNQLTNETSVAPQPEELLASYQMVLSLDDGVEKALQLSKLSIAMTQEARQNIDFQAELIRQYESDPSSQQGQEIMKALVEVQSPKVAEFAIQLAHSLDQKEVKYGLNYIAEKTELDDRDLGAIKTALVVHYDEDVVINALSSIKGVSASKHQLKDMRESLNGLAAHESEEVRVEALHALARIASDASDLEPILSHLSSEDRYAAYSALYDSNVTDPDVGEKLYEAMSNPNEDMEIRQLAALSLSRFALDTEQFDVYKAFKTEFIDH